MSRTCTLNYECSAILSDCHCTMVINILKAPRLRGFPFLEPSTIRLWTEAFKVFLVGAFEADSSFRFFSTSRQGEVDRPLAWIILLPCHCHQDHLTEWWRGYDLWACPWWLGCGMMGGHRCGGHIWWFGCGWHIRWFLERHIWNNRRWARSCVSQDKGLKMYPSWCLVWS